MLKETAGKLSSNKPENSSIKWGDTNQGDGRKRIINVSFKWFVKVFIMLT